MQAPVHDCAGDFRGQATFLASDHALLPNDFSSHITGSYLAQQRKQLPSYHGDTNGHPHSRQLRQRL